MSGRVFIIDDDPVMRRVLTRVLNVSGYQTTTAADGEGALAALTQSETPTLIICDLWLPDLCGVEVVRRLRADERFQRIPILMLTGEASEENRSLALESGADSYLTKPCSSTELLTSVRQLILDTKTREESAA
jgi:DNA-binding response OmpR family regulator